MAKNKIKPRQMEMKRNVMEMKQLSSRKRTSSRSRRRRGD